jgi:tellurite resistance protein
MAPATHGSPPGFDAPKLEALVEMMVLAASADGEFSADERAHFARSVESLTDKAIDGEAFERLVGRIQADLAAGGRAARLASLKQRLPDAAQRRVALALAVRVMAADGLIRTSERELILEVAEALEIDGDEAAKVVRDNAS